MSTINTVTNAIRMYGQRAVVVFLSLSINYPKMRLREAFDGQEKNATKSQKCC